MTLDWFGFNAGVFLIRVCEWSIKLLADAIALPRLLPDTELGFFEQTALQKMFDTDARIGHRLYVPRHWFNVYDDKNAPEGEITYAGSMIVHFPALGGRRLKAMGTFLDQLERNAAQVQLPIENTTYPAETDAYWARLGDAYLRIQEARRFEAESRSKDESFYQQVRDVFGKVHEATDALASTIRTEAFAKQNMLDRTHHLARELRVARKQWRLKVAASEGKEPDETEGEAGRGDQDDEATTTAAGRPQATPIHDEDGEKIPQSPGG